MKNSLIHSDKSPKQDIFDLANWFLAKEPMTHKKLQKLCYYAVAWGWALMNKPIVKDSDFEAWVHGPVSKPLYDKYKGSGWNNIKKEKESPKFPSDIEELLKSVWDTYGDKDGNELEALSHSEKPWKEARTNLNEEERGDVKINPETMKSFYLSIYAGSDA